MNTKKTKKKLKKNKKNMFSGRRIIVIYRIYTILKDKNNLHK